MVQRIEGPVDSRKGEPVEVVIGDDVPLLVESRDGIQAGDLEYGAYRDVTGATAALEVKAPSGAANYPLAGVAYDFDGVGTNDSWFFEIPNAVTATWIESEVGYDGEVVETAADGKKRTIAYLRFVVIKKPSQA